MAKQSAGLLMFRRTGHGPEVLLVHLGGPFWAKRDEGAWTIPKGEPAGAEELLLAAQREFSEETGFDAHGPFQDLGTIVQARGKKVAAWCFEGNCDPAALKSNVCEIEWPPRSKRTIRIPEVDRGAWFPLPEARERILKSQVLLIDRLEEFLSGTRLQLLSRGEQRYGIISFSKVAQTDPYQAMELRWRQRYALSEAQGYGGQLFQARGRCKAGETACKHVEAGCLKLQHHGAGLTRISARSGPDFLGQAIDDVFGFGKWDVLGECVSAEMDFTGRSETTGLWSMPRASS